MQKYSGTGSYLLNLCRALVRTIPEVLHPVPVGIVPCRNGLADARRAVAEADVAITLARIAELCQSLGKLPQERSGELARDGEVVDLFTRCRDLPVLKLPRCGVDHGKRMYVGDEFACEVEPG